jgi:flagellar hook-associated protein 2
MATISSLGTGSGLDLSGMLTKLMAVEQLPVTQLQTKEATYTAKLTAVGTLKSATAAFQTASDALAASTLFQGNTATSSNTSVISATASTAAKTGTYNLNVLANAQAQTLASATFASMTDPLNGTSAGQLKIELGTYDSSGNTFTTNSSKDPVTVAIPANASLSDIRDAINNSNSGVTASIISVGSAGYKLSLTSNATGASNSIKLTSMDSSGNAANNNTGLAQLSFDPTAATGSGKEFTVGIAAQDAHLQLNGIDLYRSSNTVSDAITGVTLTLGSTTGSSTLTVAQDTSSISTAITNFVKAYNDLNTQIQSSTSYDQTTNTAAALTGDATTRTLQSSLRSLLSTSVNTGVTGISTLSDIGVAFQKDGSLTFDASKLTTALNTSSTAVQALFSAKSSSTSTVEGVATKLSSALTDMLGDSGLFAAKTDGLNATIKQLKDQQDELTRRLSQVEANYRAQFTALDTTIAQMQSTSSYLTQQLASMSSSSSSK